MNNLLSYTGPQYTKVMNMLIVNQDHIRDLNISKDVLKMNGAIDGGVLSV